MMEARPLVCVHVCVCVWVGGGEGAPRDGLQHGHKDTML